MNKNQFGVYVHIPFCVKKCNYCDFLSFPADDETKEAYVKALIREIRGLKRDKRSAASVFFGGGTPSVLDAGLIVSVLDEIRSHYSVADDAEITIECNPETLDYDKAKCYISGGINRISFGLQSTDDRILSMLGRIHTYDRFVESYNIARKCGFSNINIDMMAALPSQTVDEYLAGLRKTAELEPEHISAYSLIVEEGTHIYDNPDLYPELPSEEEDRQMYHQTSELLEMYGFKRYEISNYAKAGYQSRHNLSYWELTDYVGVGLGASGFYDGKRYTDTSDMNQYIKTAGTAEFPRDIQQETQKDLMSEFMFLGLRKMAGVSYEEFRDIFKCDIKSVYGTQIEKYKNKGLLEEYVDSSGTACLRLTALGIDLSNVVMSEFV